LLQTNAPAQIASHAHDTSWENLLVLEAQGDLELRGRSYSITGGESLHIAPGVRHGYVSRGPTRFVALQLYTPAGPEQRFLAPRVLIPAAAATDGRKPPEPL
jgi:quercetin dioxygenase-like cupin family protein